MLELYSGSGKCTYKVVKKAKAEMEKNLNVLMMEKNIIGVKNGLKMTNHGVILSTVEYGVNIQKSIINIALKDEVKKDHAKKASKNCAAPYTKRSSYTGLWPKKYQNEAINFGNYGYHNSNKTQCKLPSHCDRVCYQKRKF